MNQTSRVALRECVARQLQVVRIVALRRSIHHLLEELQQGVDWQFLTYNELWSHRGRCGDWKTRMEAFCESVPHALS